MTISFPVQLAQHIPVSQYISPDDTVSAFFKEGVFATACEKKVFPATHSVYLSHPNHNLTLVDAKHIVYPMEVNFTYEPNTGNPLYFAKSC